MLTYKTVKIVCNYRRNALWFRNSSRRDCLKPTGVREPLLFWHCRALYFFPSFFSVGSLGSDASEFEWTHNQRKSLCLVHEYVDVPASFFFLVLSFSNLYSLKNSTLQSSCVVDLCPVTKVYLVQALFPHCARSQWKKANIEILTGNVIIICVLLHQVRCCVLLRV